MKRSARIIVACVTCLLLGSLVATAAAQTPAPPHHSADERSAQVDDALRLSPLKISPASLRMRRSDESGGFEGAVDHIAQDFAEAAARRPQPARQPPESATRERGSPPSLPPRPR